MTAQPPNQLFRTEALAHQQQRLLGAVNLAQPLSLYLWCIGLFVITLAVLGMMLFTEHHRKEKVRGYLVPAKGLMRVQATTPAIVSEVYVREGETVEPGAFLVGLERPRPGADGVDLGEAMTQQLETQLALLRQRRETSDALAAEQALAGATRLTMLDKKIGNMRNQQQLALQRRALLEKQLAGQRRLYIGGYFSQSHLDAAELNFLSEQISTEQLTQQLLQLEQDRDAARAQLEQRTLHHELESAELAAEEVQLEQQLDESRGAFQSVIRATEAGVVTAVQVKGGQHVRPGYVVLTLVPRQSMLVAELLLPSRSIGLVEAGNPVRFRFDAFPYQQYGLMPGELLSIDRAMLTPDSQLQGQAVEPVYRARAYLDHQQMIRGAARHPLRAGMLLEADLLLERRRLLDWVIQPLKGLGQRW